MIKGKNVISITQDATLEDASKIMVSKKIGGLPVLEGDIVVGILTDTDLLAHLTDLLGERVPGVRVTFRAPERVGMLAGITNAIAAQGWGIYASGYVKTPKQPDYWDYVFKVHDAPKDKVVEVLEGFEDVEILDIRETT